VWQIVSPVPWSVTLGHKEAARLSSGRSVKVLLPMILCMALALTGTRRGRHTWRSLRLTALVFLPACTRISVVWPRNSMVLDSRPTHRWAPSIDLKNSEDDVWFFACVQGQVPLSTLHDEPCFYNAVQSLIATRMLSCADFPVKTSVLS